MENKENLQAVGAITIILGAFATLVLSPVLTFWFAYLGGMILNYFVGDKITHGLNIVFDTTRFTNNLIPLTCATLATVGKYFKSTSTNNIKK